MVQPISLLMSQFNVENSAQLTRSALAAAQETGQGQEVVRDSLRRTQMVQANEAAAGVRKVRRRTDEEEREGRRRDARDSFGRSEPKGDAEAGAVHEAAAAKVQGKGFDFYA
ncbi:hypothetical protein [Fretibacterium fastidiosum]|uniref:Uncharacterized protein n=1 Tax=Fretibacterium fastidiosum TaxID=651822 RepID=A0AB94IXR6_9BACT|nr:hypothetical protein [Fretibacterium fastidiosum]CBL28633.1 hypothetical protein SY1_16840 [Fretibacterium fastidiosum]